MAKTKIYNVFIAVLMVIGLAACTDVDDIRFPRNGGGSGDGGDNYYDPLDDAVVTALRTHTEGTNGFKVVIMGDGFTQKDIDNGTYRKATQKAVDALFCMEPMASLKNYFDIYEITAASEYGYIDTKVHETVFRTKLVGNGTTAIYGDSIEVQRYAYKALGFDKNMLKNAVIICLLNTDGYAGSTIMATDETVKDSISGGLSLAYVPINPTLKGKEVFNLVLQHEAVGHGIARLADEYYYNMDAPNDEVEGCKQGQKYGFYLNIHYHDLQGGVKYSSLISEDGKTTYPLYYHEMENDTPAYPFTRQPEYDAEELKWYQGAGTFRSKFYRPTRKSIMNQSVEEGNDKYNAPSRLMIYKRVMRVAYGDSWTFDIRKQIDMDQFKAFDQKGMWSKASTTPTTAAAKGLSNRDWAMEYTEQPAIRHASPKIFKPMTDF